MELIVEVLITTKIKNKWQYKAEISIVKGFLSFIIINITGTHQAY